MRIIGGEFRSRRLVSPPEDVATRPIPDRVKESLFSILRGHTEGAAVFDGFAGSGAIGLEALSRGAARCVFVERDRKMGEVLQKNIDALGVTDRAEVVVGDALGAGALARCPSPATIVMLDPPYDMVRDQVGLKRVKAQLSGLVQRLSGDGFAVLRTPWPLFHTVPIVEGAVAPPVEVPRRGPAARKPKRREARPPAKDRWEEVWTLERAGKHADPAQAGLDESADDGDAPLGAGFKHIDADISVAGAKGPETHVYGTMAVHLYMRG